MLIVATCSLLLTRLGKGLEKKSAAAVAKLDGDGDGQVSKREILEFWRDRGSLSLRRRSSRTERCRSSVKSKSTSEGGVAPAGGVQPDVGDALGKWRTKAKAAVRSDDGVIAVEARMVAR